MATKLGEAHQQDENGIREAIAASYLSEGLSPVALDQLASYGEWRSYEASEVILHQEDEDSNLLILADGRAEINTFANDPLYFLHPGMVFGEVSLIDEKPRSATVRALEPCEVVVLSAEGVRGLMFSQPELGIVLLRNLAKLLCSRIRAGNQQLAALLTLEELRDGKV